MRAGGGKGQRSADQTQTNSRRRTHAALNRHLGSQECGCGLTQNTINLLLDPFQTQTYHRPKIALRSLQQRNYVVRNPKPQSRSNSPEEEEDATHLYADRAKYNNKHTILSTV